MTTETTYATDIVTDEQWNAIDRRLDGNLTEDGDPRRPDRGRVRFLLWAAVAIVILGLAAGWVTATVLPGDVDRSATTSVSTVRGVIGIAAFVVAVVVWAVGVVVLIRRGGISWSWREPTQELPRAQRRAINDVFRGRAQEDPARRSSLRRVALTRMSQIGWMLCLISGLLPFSIGQVAVGWGEWTGAVHLGLAVLWVVGVASAVRQRRRLRAFLAAHPSDGGEPASGS